MSVRDIYCNATRGSRDNHVSLRWTLLRVTTCGFPTKCVRLVALVMSSEETTPCDSVYTADVTDSCPISPAISPLIPSSPALSAAENDDDCGAGGSSLGKHSWASPQFPSYEPPLATEMTKAQKRQAVSLGMPLFRVPSGQNYAYGTLAAHPVPIS